MRLFEALELISSHREAESKAPGGQRTIPTPRDCRQARMEQVRLQRLALMRRIKILRAAKRGAERGRIEQKHAENTAG